MTSWALVADVWYLPPMHRLVSDQVSFSFCVGSNSLELFQTKNTYNVYHTPEKQLINWPSVFRSLLTLKQKFFQVPGMGGKCLYWNKEQYTRKQIFKILHLIFLKNKLEEYSLVQKIHLTKLEVKCFERKESILTGLYFWFWFCSSLSDSLHLL